eukprot:767138-Hanusia_phi.AAC.2
MSSSGIRSVSVCYIEGGEGGIKREPGRTGSKSRERRISLAALADFNDPWNSRNQPEHATTEVLDHTWKRTLQKYRGWYKAPVQHAHTLSSSR